MSYEPTDVFVKDQFGDPVQGVVVRIFNPSGTIVFTQQTTDADGKASFLLFTQEYSMRFYQFHTTFSQPQLFTVLEAPAVNQFNVTAQVFVPPISSDARFCRCSGFFRDVDGSPQEFLDMHFVSEFNPVLVEGAAIVPRTVAIRTDERGYAQIDLIRGGKYKVTVEAIDPDTRCIRVPDLPSANLPDVLFAVVDHIDFDVDPPYEVPLSGTLVLTPAVFDSAGAELTGTAVSDVDWTLSDTSLASLVVGETTLTIRGIAAGSLELRASRRDQSVVRIPNIVIEGVPLSLTVL